MQADYTVSVTFLGASFSSTSVAFLMFIACSWQERARQSRSTRRPFILLGMVAIYSTDPSYYELGRAGNV